MNSPSKFPVMFGLILLILLALILLAPILSGGISPGRASSGALSERAFAPAGPGNTYLPLVFKGVMLDGTLTTPRINAPYFSGDIPYGEMAIAWFGRVDSTNNYADIRTGYNDNELYVNLAVFDRRLWYDTTPTRDTLTQWDAVSLVINLDGNKGTTPGARAYRFDAQLNWGSFEPRENFQAVYRGNGSGWANSSIAFTTTTGWQGNAPNDNSDDRGWAARIHIPFTSLGLSARPPQGTVWGMAVVLHDRDDAAGTAIPVKTWPKSADANRPETWGQVRYGIPGYQAPPSSLGGTVTIRNGENGASVVDGKVGGGTVCGDGLDFWTQWGNTASPGSGTNADFNVQNQGNIADWPCFSKVYINFPLTAIPAGKVIRSAKLILHEFGSSDPTHAQRSYIQVLTVTSGWNEATLTWNNAPLAAQNFIGAWVDPTNFPDWPGIQWEWDVSYQVAQAYQAGGLLRLALYSADSPLHSGKYFSSSEAGDWNKTARPTIIVEWGNP